MVRRQSLREELQSLRSEIEALKSARAQPDDAISAEKPELSGLERQLEELGHLAQTMLDEAEETVADHPVATVAGALALGIVIGRLSAR